MEKLENRVSGMIKSIRPYTRKKDSVEMVVITLAGQANAIHLSAKQVRTGAEIKGNFRSLEGSTLTVDFFAKGEAMLNGVECTKDQTIIKTFEFEEAVDMQKLGKAAAKGMAFTI